MWTMALSLIPRKAIIPALTAAVVGFAVWWVYDTGVDNGQRELLSEIEGSRAEAVEEKERIDDEIRKLDRDALLERALGAVAD